MTKLNRTVLRLDEESQERIDEIVDLMTALLRCEVSRSAVIRAAVKEWLANNDGVEPEKMIESISKGIVKRGRKKRKPLQLRIKTPDGTEKVQPREILRFHG